MTKTDKKSMSNMSKWDKEAKEKEWKIVHESDTDNGKPTCWALEINHKIYGKYVWITGLLDYDEETIVQYNVEVIPDKDARILVECKSLASAKRWVAMNLL